MASNSRSFKHRGTAREVSGHSCPDEEQWGLDDWDGFENNITMRGTNTGFHGFEGSLLRFLGQLTRNNNREWFQQNKLRYEAEVLQPAQAFIRAFADELKKISTMMMADDRRVGGSLMRVYRDTRFSKDKTPYKTNLGIQFRHEMGKDIHAPGFYVHLAPDQCFLGAGIWMPDNSALTKVRTAIVDNPAKWKRVRDGKRFRQHFELAGDQLKSAPRGFDKNHACIDDLRRTSFIAVKTLARQEVLASTLVRDVAATFAASKPFMRYLCEANGLPF